MKPFRDPANALASAACATADRGGLLGPFDLLCEPLGTVWVMSHSDGRAFGSTPIAPARGIEAVIVNGELV